MLSGKFKILLFARSAFGVEAKRKPFFAETPACIEVDQLLMCEFQSRGLRLFIEAGKSLEVEAWKIIGLVFIF